MARYSDTVTNTKTGGTPYPIIGALIAVKSSSGTTPTLYADDGVTVLDNPLTSDNYGTYYFNAPDDFYDLTYIYGGRKILERAGIPVGVVGLAAGYVADSMGSGTIVAPSQRAVTAAISTVQAQVTGNTTAIANNTANIATNTTNIANEVTRATASEAALSVRVDVISARPHSTFVSLPGNSSITSSTTLVTDPNLSIPIAANSLTAIRLRVNYSTGATGDFKYRVIGPASPTAVQINRRSLAPGDTVETVASDTAYSGSDIPIAGVAGSGTIDIEIVVANGANAGNVGFQWAQNASDATATILKAGSSAEYISLPTQASFAFANAAIAKLGDYSGPTFSGGHNFVAFYQPSSISNSYIETMVTGTTADAQLLAGTYTITVDGVPSVVVAPTGWTYVPLFTSLPDTAHRVRIKGSVIDSDISIRVSGIAPNITRPTDIPPYYRIYDAAYATYISKDGAPDDFTGLYGGSVGTADYTTACGEGHRFNATTTSVVAWLYCAAGASQVELLQDNVSLGVFTLPSLGMMERVTLATGLSGAHEYEIRPFSSGDYFYCFAIMVDALTAAAHANKSLYAWYGDSNTQMQIGEDARTHASFLLAKRRGWANVRRGVGGQSISTWGRDNAALVTSDLSQAPDVILTMLGVNDYYFSTPLATLQADCTTMLANIRAGDAGAPIVVLGIHDHYRAQADGTPYSNANRVLYNNRLQAAVAARVTAGDANVFYIDTTGWINVTPGVNLRDPVHLNAAGFIAYEAALNPALVAIGL